MLAKRLQTCVAFPFTDDSPSDHTPIVAAFKIEGDGCRGTVASTGRQLMPSRPIVR
jgi:hypothetical protein